MNPRSLANLAPRLLPPGMQRVEVDVYLPPSEARAWRRLTPSERGELIVLALRVRESGG